MKDIKVGTQVSRQPAGIMLDGVVTRVDTENQTAGGVWRVEDGLLAQTEKFSNLIVIKKDEEDQRSS